MLTIRLATILSKQGISTRGTSCTLHSSREPTTVAFYLNVFYKKLLLDILKVP
jgi:hypothetical protein